MSDCLLKDLATDEALHQLQTQATAKTPENQHMLSQLEHRAVTNSAKKQDSAKLEKSLQRKGESKVDEDGLEEHNHEVAIPEKHLLKHILGAAKAMNDHAAKVAEVEGNSTKDKDGGLSIHENETHEAVVKDVLDILNSITSKMSIEDAADNGVLATSDLIEEITGVKGESVGCHHNESHDEGNNELCYEGDMHFSSKEEIQLFQSGGRAEVNSKGRRFVAAGRPWKDGVINLCFAADIPESLLGLIQIAILQYEHAVPCLTFKNVGNSKKYKSDSPDLEKQCDVTPAIFIQAHKQSGCWSYIGQMDSPIPAYNGNLKTQLLNLMPVGCEVLGIVIHELGHAIGMAHEQARPDRDKYVSIVWDNIPQAMRVNFVVNQGGYMGEPYDYMSVMHYGSKDFGVGGKQTIKTKGGQWDAHIGQRVGLSQTDANQLEAMYTDQVAGGCKAKQLQNGKKGCIDIKPFICRKLTACSSEVMTSCCACGGGIKYQCWEGSWCRQPKQLAMNDDSACVQDMTAMFKGQYPCVIQNACAYNIKVVCPNEHPGAFWMFNGPSSYVVSPWADICTAKAACTFQKA